MTELGHITLADLIGIPYADHGRSLQGADCYGIVCLYHRHVLGARLPDYLGLYNSADDSAGTALAFVLGRRAWRFVLPDEVRAGDVVLLRVMGYPCHCGVLIGRGYDFLHTLRGRNSAIDRLDGIGWRDRVEGVWRWTS